MTTTTLIFATEHDASPLIELFAEPDAVREYLDCIVSFGDKDSCGNAACQFLRSLGPDLFAKWQPSIESTVCGDVFEISSREWLVWCPKRWIAWDLTTLKGAMEPEAPLTRAHERAVIGKTYCRDHADKLIPEAGEGAPAARFKEVSEDRYNEMLGCVPPAIHMAKGFLVGEAWCGKRCTLQDCSVGCRHPFDCDAYHAYLHVDGRFYEMAEPFTVGEFRALDAHAAITDEQPRGFV